MSDNDNTKDQNPRKVVVNLPLKWSDYYLSEQVRHLRMTLDKEGNVWTMPTFLAGIDSTSGAGTASDVGLLSMRSSFGTKSAIGEFSFKSLFTLGIPLVSNPLTTYYEPTRTPTHFKTLETAVAAATAPIWAPGAGAKFRLLGGTVCMGGTIAAAAKRSLKLVEETTATVIAAFGIDIPILGNNIALSFDLRPNGYLASAADLDLNVITAGATYVTGSDWVTVWGTQE